MNRKNLANVVLAGLVAGGVISVGNFLLNRILLRGQLKADLARLNLPEPGIGFNITAALLTLILGIVLFFLYAAIPTEESKLFTALWLGVAAWFFSSVYTGVIIGMVFRLSAGLTIERVLFSIFPYLIGSVGGMIVYERREFDRTWDEAHPKDVIHDNISDDPIWG